MRPLPRSRWRLAACMLVASTFSCASPNRGLDAGDAQGDDATGPGGPSDAGGDEVLTFVGADATGPGGCTVCSTDLHQVLDCTAHQVIATCPRGQACGPGGTCIDPCASATANKSSVGCEYYAINPESRDPGWCYVAFVANTWTSPVSMTVEYAGQPLDVSNSAFLVQGSGSSLRYAPLPGGAIPPNGVALLFLADSLGNSGGQYGVFDASIRFTGIGEPGHAGRRSPRNKGDPAFSGGCGACGDRRARARDASRGARTRGRTRGAAMESDAFGERAGRYTIKGCARDHRPLDLVIARRKVMRA